MSSKCRALCLTILATVSLAACSAPPAPAVPASEPNPPTAAIVERGTFDCFPAGLTRADGKTITCETSAVAKSGRELIFASDKPVPGPERSSVFAMAGGADGVVVASRRYLAQADILKARKFEAMTVTPDGQTILASTGFDRVKPASPKWDAYNTLLAWPAGREDEVEVVARSTREGVASSLAIREKLAQALKSDAFVEGAPYFKVEGLAALPDGRLLFGIREVGRSYKDFDYTMKIVSVTYEIGTEGLSLGGDFKLIYEFETSPVEALGGKQVGLSSLEYDPFHDRLYLLTSYELEESDEGLGGFLWVLPIADLHARKPPSLVLKPDGHPLTFAHKSEGLAVIDARHLFVVHDDDRVLGRARIDDAETQFRRSLHQAAYSVVRLD